MVVRSLVVRTPRRHRRHFCSVIAPKKGEAGLPTINREFEHDVLRALHKRKSVAIPRGGSLQIPAVHLTATRIIRTYGIDGRIRACITYLFILLVFVNTHRPTRVVLFGLNK